MISYSHDWQAILDNLSRQHLVFDAVRCGVDEKRQDESLPPLARIAGAICARQLNARDTTETQPLRLAMIAPRWENGASWVAAAATLCAMRDDFIRLQGVQPPLEIGKKYRLDKTKIVQYEGEDAKGLRLRVADGVLGNVPFSYRVRLQPTSTQRPLSRVAWAGAGKPDLLDALLQIECWGSRHLFSTRVVLATSVAHSVETARRTFIGQRPAAALFLSLPQRLHLAQRAKRLLRALHETQVQTSANLTNNLHSCLEIFIERAQLPQISEHEHEEMLANLRAIFELPSLRYHRSETVGAARDCLEEMSREILTTAPAALPSVELLQLFQMGALNLQGEVEIKSAGQVEAEPALLLAPDLLAFRSYLRTRKADASKSTDAVFQPPLLLLDGAKTFRHHLDVLDQILASRCSVIALLDRCEEDAVRPLRERGFECWRWTPREIGALSRATEGAEPLFGAWRKRLNNYAKHRFQECLCAHDSIDRAAAALHDFLSAQPENAAEEELEAIFYGVLLQRARSLHAGDKNLFATRLEKARGEIGRRRLEIAPQRAAMALSFLDHLATTPDALESKAAKLREVVAKADAGEFLVVAADEVEAEKARHWWRETKRADETLRRKNVRFCVASAVEKQLASQEAQHLILCGWLGSNRMRSLLDGCLAADITLLLYAFERGWLRSALRRWRTGDDTLSATRRAQLLGLPEDAVRVLAPHPVEDEPLGTLQQAAPPAEVAASDFDVMAFEVRLHHQRRLALVGAHCNSHEETETARLVEFGGEHFAFLGDRCRLPIVTALMQQAEDAASTRTRRNLQTELPQKRADELQVGDYVVFRRGASGNLIRELADGALRRSGQSHLRELAGLWRVALREYSQRENAANAALRESDKRRALVEQLRAAGIEREAQTLLGWIEHEHTIGPSQPEEIIPRLAQLTGHEELRRRSGEVVRAISAVRGAHLTASSVLAQSLMQRLPAFLAQSRSAQTDDAERSDDGWLEIEIQGLGAADVVRVEEIAAETLPLARSRVNVLQRETTAETLII